jgi:hypothetical protein
MRLQDRVFRRRPAAHAAPMIYASTMPKTPLKKTATFSVSQLLIKGIPSNCMAFRRRKNLSAAKLK